MTGHPEQRPLVLIGTGGHAKVILDIARLTHRAIAGVLSPETTNYLALKTLGDDNLLKDHGFLAAHDFVIALGDTRKRRRIASSLSANDATLAILTHPGSIVAADVEIDGGTALLAGVIVNSGTRISTHCILNTGCSVDHDCRLESGVHIAPGARLCGHVICRQDAFIGAGAVIVPDQEIGLGAIVGAGATVLSSVPPAATVVGTPARTAV